jgi:hypothetical protein
VTQQINLFNPAFIPKRELLTGQNLAWAALALVLVIGPASYWTRVEAKQKAAEAEAIKARQKQTQEMVDTLIKAAQSRKPSPALQAEIDQVKRLIALREEVLAAASEGGERADAGFADYLTGLARQARDGLWLSGFSVAAGGSHMALSGRVVDKSLLPEYIRRLNNEPAFSGKSFGGLQMERHESLAKSANGAVAPAPTSQDRSGEPERFIEFRLVAEQVASAERKP